MSRENATIARALLSLDPSDREFLERVRAMGEHDRVRLFVQGMNLLSRLTGLVPLGTQAEETALRLVHKKGFDAYASRLTCDALHYERRARPDGEWVDGPEHRRRADPAWAKQMWGDENRPSGNARLTGEGPRTTDDAETLRKKATRKPYPKDTATCEHARVRHEIGLRINRHRCLDCGKIL
jgi:hypothetical protein